MVLGKKKKHYQIPEGAKQSRAQRNEVDQNKNNYENENQQRNKIRQNVKIGLHSFLMYVVCMSFFLFFFL